MTNMKAVIDSLAEAGGCDRVKVIVGGAPVTESYATQSVRMDLLLRPAVAYR